MHVVHDWYTLYLCQKRQALIAEDPDKQYVDKALIEEMQSTYRWASCSLKNIVTSGRLFSLSHCTWFHSQFPRRWQNCVMILVLSDCWSSCILQTFVFRWDYGLVSSSEIQWFHIATFLGVSCYSISHGRFVRWLLKLTFLLFGLHDCMVDRKVWSVFFRTFFPC